MKLPMAPIVKERRYLNASAGGELISSCNDIGFPAESLFTIWRTYQAIAPKGPCHLKSNEANFNHPSTPRLHHPQITTMKSRTKLRFQIELPMVKRAGVPLEITAALRQHLQSAALRQLEKAVTEGWIIDEYLRFRRQQEKQRREQFDTELYCSRH